MTHKWNVKLQSPDSEFCAILPQYEIDPRRQTTIEHKGHRYILAGENHPHDWDGTDMSRVELVFYDRGPVTPAE